ncbi:cytochrome P450 9c1-like [Episyrphus balteatus]|uniref:cytochrome P450 9c1-like n=1 Tax=Episyrphus balteatus TaxID=286459 RepID=UPI002484E274|nr:cytochrome P450 9c1-like [Episyrphus balteatus]
MEYIVEIFCSSIIFGYLFYKWANKNFNYFSKLNIAHEKPVFLIGNNLPVLEGRESSPEFLIRLHNQFKDEKIYGYYEFRTPNLIIRDRELIEKITNNVPNFLNSSQNKAFLSDDTTGNMISVLQDKKYLDMSLMSEHIFMEDKISQVFTIIMECNKAAIKYLKDTIKAEGKEIDLEDYFHRYSNDVVAAAAFGMEINSYKYKDNKFSTSASNLLRSRSLFAAIKSFYLTITPYVYRIYRLNRVYIKILKFLRNLITRIFAGRQINKIVPKDSNSMEEKSEVEFSNIVSGLIRKFSSTIKAVVLIIFPQISILINLGYFILNIRYYVKSFFKPKSKKLPEEKPLLEDDADPQDKNKNQFLRIGGAIWRSITGGIKSLIFCIFPQVILVHQLYIYTKTLIKYMKGKTVQQDVLHKKKKLSKIDSALLKLERFIVVVKLFILTNFPAVSKIFKLKAFNTKALNYMKSKASETIQERQNKKIIRLDMIHLMLEAWKNEDDIFVNDIENRNRSKFSENDWIAQCIMFIFAGIEPMTNLLCNTLYELMKNPEIQEKLYEEVSKMNEQLKGADISYDLLIDKMKYMNMVVMESLRKWPEVPLRNRVCSKPYTLKDIDGKIVQEFKTGDKLYFNVYGSHYDEENFENPFTFDPERFNDENILKKKTYTYFPFGYGAKVCRGKKFGLMVTKIMLYHLILEFKIDCGTKSTRDLFAATRKIQLKQSDFFWMKLYPRNIEPKPELNLLGESKPEQPKPDEPEPEELKPEEPEAEEPKSEEPKSEEPKPEEFESEETEPEESEPEEHETEELEHEPEEL